MSKRALSVGILTAGLSAGLVAGAISPAAAQGNPVGGSGNVYYLGGAGSIGGKAQETLVFGDPGDEIYFGDWDNDGVDTPMVNRNGVFHVANKDGKTIDVFAYGNPGDRVVIGDWDGKNGDSMAVVRTEQGSNKFYVKNDVKTTGKADAEFFYGDAGDNLLVGDWDGNGTDTLMVTRPDTSFHVKNDTKTGVADYSFFYGNPGDNVIVGDWANPATYTDGNGADQIAVRRDGNHYFLSNELGKGKAITALRDFYYGEPTDTVFVASLPSTVGKVGDAKVALDDVFATHKKGEPVLRLHPTTGVILAPELDSFGDPKTYAGGEAKAQFKGAPKYYLGTEPVLTADGKPMVYVAVGDADEPHEVELPGPSVPRSEAGDYDLNADGSLKYVAGDDVDSPAVLGTDSSETIAIAVGDVVLQRRGAPVEHVAGTPAVYELAGEYVANTDVETSEIGDYKLDANGNPIWDADANDWVKLTAPVVKVGGFAPGTPVTERRGEAMAINASVYTPAAALRTFTGTVSSTASTVTVSDGNFTAADIDRDIDGTGIAAAAKITSVQSPTTVTVSVPNTGPVSGTITLPAVANGWSVAAPVSDDELRNAYIFDVAPAASYVPTATDKKVSDLDADTKSEPPIYIGTERVLFAAGDDRSVAPYAGGERVVSQKKGTIFLNADGTRVKLSAGDVEILGDGLGVRRNFGR
ncbi:hypothetical protein [Geodermatophilus ruber]|uniref:Uncharacterized protein n=1 Tax=Geodermatophilus ruber TaxID=504800 RepID=A0A1I4LPN7_9ACTN|nr:hypothetical protein [Geodermatophilus ruber]SFL93068.1 hypothetical protein SAMN04488085_12321 [Geodermatophilus ruber]